MPYYGPDEDEHTKNLERFFMAGDFISGVGYGIQILLYYYCATFLWSRRQRGRQALYLLAYITLLFIIETIFCVVQANTVQLVYIDNRNYPSGPWQFFLDTQYLADNVIFYATLFLLTFFADLLVLWRCWVIWRVSGTWQAYTVIAFPAIVLLASFAMGTLWTLQSSHPGLSMYSKLPQAYGTAYYAISLGVNIMLTILIMIRLLMFRRSILDGLPADHAKDYISLATIIIESAALYSVFSILFLVTYGVNNAASQILLGIASDAQQIASYLIIYRVAEGRAWTKDTMRKSSQTLPTVNPSSGPLQFNHIKTTNESAPITRFTGFHHTVSSSEGHTGSDETQGPGEPSSGEKKEGAED